MRKDGAAEKDASSTAMAAILEDERRWVRLDGCRNFRDVGGYPTDGGGHVRWRRLFRSDKLEGLTSGDIRHLCDEIGLRAIVDLRRATEAGDLARSPLAGRAQLTRHHLSLNREDDRGDPDPPEHGLGHIYLWMIDGLDAVVRDLFDLLARDDTYPVVLHCMGGKDRTGIAIALALDTLGVPDELIVADYALTELSRLSQPKESLEAAFRFVQEQQLPEEVLYARPESMRDFLAGLRERFGSVGDYLRACGVTDETMTAVRTNLLART